jgi:hypothetical protein
MKDAKVDSYHRKSIQAMGTKTLNKHAVSSFHTIGVAKDGANLQSNGIGFFWSGCLEAKLE